MNTVPRRRSRRGRSVRRSTHPPPKRLAGRGNSAFTLVELIVAILLLSVGLLALLSTAIATTRQIESAFAQIEAKAIATRDIERLRSQRCSAADSVDHGLQSVTVVIERHTVARESADTFYATIAC